MLQQFTTYIKQHHLFHQKDKLLLAVSGGVDSVVLCELCHQAGFDFAIAHCNFQLRGQESERDEKFVEALAKKYGVKFFVKQFDTEKYAPENKLNIQVAARELRYAWFNELANEFLTNRRQGLQPLTGLYILTAHHGNDNIETVLMNFFKGTGIQGLRGILPKQKKIIRPLLFATKESILQFAKENNLTFVEDSSNASNKYTRNYFRNELIPAIKEKFPQVEENLLANINRFKDIETLYQQAMEIHKIKLLEQKGNEIHIPVLKLAKAKPLQTIVYEIIESYGFSSKQVDDVIKLLDSESGKYIENGDYRILRNRKWLIISPKNNNEANTIVIEKDDSEISYEKGMLALKTHSTFDIQHSKFEIQIDASKITYPLLLRKWEQGDYFYPIGMKHKKKLSRFFIDNKLSLTEKDNTWVLESNKRIVWVIGMRIDDRFKVTETTKEILQVSFKSVD